MNSEAKLKALLKKQGYSVTKPRISTFKVLVDTHEAVTITQIVAKLPNIDMVSVYRTVQLFEKAGIVQRVLHGLKSKFELSDTFSPHHHHFICNKCGTAQAINSQDLEDSLHKLEAQYGFELRQHSVELSGYCKACSANPSRI